MKQTDNTPGCQMHETLVAYLYGEATPEESNLMRAHLSECEACEQEMAAFERVRGMLQQWQVDDLPVVRVEAARKRSMFDAFKELMAIMPLWARAAGVMAAAMIVLAVLGTEVSIDGNGFRMRADVFRVGAGEPARTVAQTPGEADIEQLRAELRAMVSTLIAASENQQREHLRAQLVSLESELQAMHSAELAKLAGNIQQQGARLRVIERDIDQREGYDLTDILFSEFSSGSGQSGSGKAGSDD